MNLLQEMIMMSIAYRTKQSTSHHAIAQALLLVLKANWKAGEITI